MKFSQENSLMTKGSSLKELRARFLEMETFVARNLYRKLGEVLKLIQMSMGIAGKVNFHLNLETSFIVH